MNDVFLVKKNFYEISPVWKLLVFLKKNQNFYWTKSAKITKTQNKILQQITTSFKTFR